MENNTIYLLSLSREYNDWYKLAVIRKLSCLKKQENEAGFKNEADFKNSDILLMIVPVIIFLSKVGKTWFLCRLPCLEHTVFDHFIKF